MLCDTGSTVGACCSLVLVSYSYSGSSNPYYQTTECAIEFWYYTKDLRFPGDGQSQF